MQDKFHISFQPAQEIRDDLRKLASYLESLPRDYKHFDMQAWYLTPGSDEFSWEELTLEEFQAIQDREQALAGCGTAACAVGHSPAAKLDCLQTKWFDSWNDIAMYLSNQDLRAFEWMFSPDWADTDNTPHGAAARIRYALLHGIPYNFIDITYGDDPLPYTISFPKEPRTND